MFSGKTIFYGALDWGLGHATRSVPVIKELLKNNQLILGVTPLTKPIFEEEFPGVKKIELPSYNIRYSKVIPLWLKLGLDSMRISRIIAEENKKLEKIIRENKTDVVISDNRFGLHSEKVHSVFITHQLFVKAPVLKDYVNRINRNYISKFNEVWIPDYENETESLSGELSHGKHLYSNVKYIGPQSRLKDITADTGKDLYDYLILLSGPEPNRTELENKLIQKFASSQKRVALIRGSEFGVRSSGSVIEIHNLPGKKELKRLILSSKKIICRSGYSTLMDLHLLGKKDLILIPTPGQAEQEYLAEYWEQKFGAKALKESEVNKLINFAL